MIYDKTYYSYNDLTIIPKDISRVSSRSECNVFTSDDDTKLPIFASPMASVVSDENYELFEKNNIIPIIPRNISLEKRVDLLEKTSQWVALSLKEFTSLFIDHNKDRKPGHRYKICVDIANGHMMSLYDACVVAKGYSIENIYDLVIMTGNIANPDTYSWICKYATYEDKDERKRCAIDYIRVGIGGGSGCITTSNVSIHYPQASLVNECYLIKKYLKEDTDYKIIDYFDSDYNFPKIVADGGIRNYDHVIKALALGADYVMIGSLFSQCIESAGFKSHRAYTDKTPIRLPIERYKNFEVDSNLNWWAYYTDEFINENMKAWKYDEDIEKANERSQELKEKKFIGGIDVKFFGMASSDGQKSINGKKTKTSEGITKWLPVKFTLNGWTENMISYLRSAMSYCDCFNLSEFIGNQTLVVNSIAEVNAVNK